MYTNIYTDQGSWLLCVVLGFVYESVFFDDYGNTTVITCTAVCRHSHCWCDGITKRYDEQLSSDNLLHTCWIINCDWVSNRWTNTYWEVLSVVTCIILKPNSCQSAQDCVDFCTSTIPNLLNDLPWCDTMAATNYQAAVGGESVPYLLSPAVKCRLSPGGRLCRWLGCDIWPWSGSCWSHTSIHVCFRILECQRCCEDCQSC